MKRTDIIESIKDFIREQGIAFMSKEEEMNYYRELVELIENILEERAKAVEEYKTGDKQA